MKDFIKNSLLIFVSLGACLVTAELIFQQTSIGSYSLNRGYLFSSNPSFIAAPAKTVKYQRNTAIREVAIFGEHVEYDLTHKTNNLGYFDNVDYLTSALATDQSTASGVTGVVFLGNSFTTSAGGIAPWVATLREMQQRPDIALYSLGVSGTGIKHFYQLLKNFEQGDMPFSQVNIMAITNAFFGHSGIPSQTIKGCVFVRKICHRKY